MPRLSWFGMRRRRPRRADIERELRDHLALEAEAQEQVVDTLLFGVAPGNPVTLGIAAAGIAAAGACAALLPALRAARLDPAAILRD